MTREEAKIKIGELGMYARTQEWDDEYTEAVNMAIKALEQEPKTGMNMADIELVIKIPEVLKKAFEAERWTSLSCMKMKDALMNGTPLPKGHGDLIDVNRKITVPIYDEQYEEWGEKILTVREALNRWSNEGITVKDVVILADKTESEEV